MISAQQKHHALDRAPKQCPATLGLAPSTGRRTTRPGVTISQSTRIRLAADISAVHTQGWNTGAWDGYDYYSPRWFENIARTAERGLFDMLFFGDSAGAQEIGGSYDLAVRQGTGYPTHDRSALVAMMSKETENLGFGLTMSTQYQHPMHVARYFASMNHAMEGRIAWNAVTGAHKPEAANYGFDALPDPAERYRKAFEHIDLVRQLWNSVEPDAVVLDRETGVFADPAKIHRVDFDGEFFRSRGPLPVLPAKGGHPAIITAGQSPDGMRLAAESSDLQFVLRRSLQSMIDHRIEIDRIMDEIGRDRRELGVLWCIKIQLGDSRADAIERGERAARELDPSTGINAMSGLYGVDFSAQRPDTPLHELGPLVQAAKGQWGMFSDVLANTEEGVTLEEFARRFVFSANDTLLGTPDEIADQIDELHQSTGANGGVILRTNYTQGGAKQLENFVDHVVPVLQRRGLTRSAYTGASLRENLLD